MSKETAYVNEVGIREGDIVFVKFKPLSEIIEFYSNENYSPSIFLNESDLDYHLSAILSSGYYKVADTYSGDACREFPQVKAKIKANNETKPHEISIVNHNEMDGSEFRFNENIVEEIRVEHDAADTYFSSKFMLSLMKIDGALFVNGKLVTKEDVRLIEILENTISDLAIQKMLASVIDEDER